ncbi:dUTP diphosphatase [Candidatus Woesearchaeota archaeon]|nr:dUTP diphosphatase [Candidatus Woesearchaeota archaeon]
MKILMQKVEDVKLPSYAHPGDAGMDLFSAESLVLKPGERKVVSTGIKMAIPEGYESQIRPKSGLAAKHGISIVNTPGTIDAGYRGVVGVILINHGNEDFAVEKDMKIAQMVINKIENADIEEVNELDGTSRGEGGFGSTGTH